MTKQELYQKIAEGENQFVEFKEILPSPDDLAAEICAFTNTEGGVILCGVADNKTLTGLDNYGKLEEHVINIARNNIEPAVSIACDIKKLDEGTVIGILQIPKSPYRPHKTNLGRYYIRVGGTKRYPSKDELGRIYQDVGVVRYDLMGVEKTTIDDLDLDKINTYYQKIYHTHLFSSPLGVEQTLRNLELLTSEMSEQPRATGAGILIFGKDPQKQLPQSAVSVGVFDGTSLSDPLKDRKELTGTIDVLFEKTWEYMYHRIETRYEYKEGKRIEILAYPKEAVREVIVNALVHRNYSIQGEQIRIFLFTDKFFVASPGRLPNTITLDTLPFRRHARNPLVVDVLFNMGYVEKAGSGIVRIIEAMQKNNQTKPEFAVYGEEFRVTLPQRK